MNKKNVQDHMIMKDHVILMRYEQLKPTATDFTGSTNSFFLVLLEFC